jgi:ferredoxin
MDSNQKLPFIEINWGQCKGCTLCLDSCKPAVLKLSTAFNSLGYQYVEYSGDGCTGCEACYYACPEPNVITIYKQARVKKPGVSP